MHPPVLQPAQVWPHLPAAFPALFALDQQRRLFTRLSLDADGPAYWPVRELDTSQQIWWQIAGLVADELDARGLEWSVASGAARAAYCATVQREPQRGRRPRMAVAWADLRGLALCIAALDAVLGPELWPPVSPADLAPLTQKELCP